MSEKSLIEKAAEFTGQNYRRRHTHSKSEIEELAIAWFCGELSWGQVVYAIPMGASLRSILATAVRNAIAEGRVTLTRTGVDVVKP